MKFKKLITLASLVGLIVFLATTVVACTSKSEKTDTKTEQTSSQKDKDKDKELKEALDKAKSYDKSLKTSYDDLRVKLLEEDFSDEAINYALSNAGIDWKKLKIMLKLLSFQDMLFPENYIKIVFIHQMSN